MPLCASCLLFAMFSPPPPYVPRTANDRPLYIGADIAHTSAAVAPTSGDYIAFERISSRSERASLFFKALCQRYRPLLPDAVELKTEIVPPPLPVDWSKEEQLPKRRRLPQLLPKNVSGDVLKQVIYKPHGKWEWTTGLPFRESEPRVLLSSGRTCSAFIKTGRIADRPVQYVSKLWLTKERWHGFFSELALYKVQLKSLQGRIVPFIINVYSCVGAVDVAMEPPHSSFWVEASADMPHVLKKRCVRAFEQLHAAGVLHGDVELRHMLIGGDARVTIIDFQESRALVPNAAVKLAAATPAELRMEMRKVKYKLDYGTARDWEDQKFMRSLRLKCRNQKGDEIEPPAEEDVWDPPVSTEEWNEGWNGARPGPVRFVMPGQKAGDVERAVEEFLSILEKLEEEEKRYDGTTTSLLRKPSPEFKTPVVPTEGRGSQASTNGFGALVPLPATCRPKGVKRKVDCDKAQDEHKRIRMDASSRMSTTLRRPSARTRDTLLVPRRRIPPPLPVVKVRDFASVPRTSALKTSELEATPPLPNKLFPLSSVKRKRETCNEVDSRGRPRLRKLLSSDVSSADPAFNGHNPITAAFITVARDMSPVSGTSPAPPAVSPGPLDEVAVLSTDTLRFPTPAIFKWIKNLWRTVS
ncbi:hypothetical protein GGX14DRAFT_641209 [Mycena pura]|uniref:Protein kinase domain-containing protein n=1 Tax=Mycena pura TaxID=153505 RepID=A0AAD6YPV7_9AGAR|nr:hypothetical protein GGX14DRAFT_641209 [Mycena pura]